MKVGNQHSACKLLIWYSSLNCAWYPTVHRTCFFSPLENKFQFSSRIGEGAYLAAWSERGDLSLSKCWFYLLVLATSLYQFRGNWNNKSLKILGDLWRKSSSSVSFSFAGIGFSFLNSDTSAAICSFALQLPKLCFSLLFSCSLCPWLSVTILKKEFLYCHFDGFLKKSVGNTCVVL